MGFYDVAHLSIEFMKRTRSNVSLIKDLRKGKEIDLKEFNNVTHLLNSLFGIVILPVENLKKYVVHKNRHIFNGNSSEALKLKEYSTKLYKFISKCKNDNRYYNDYLEEITNDLNFYDFHNTFKFIKHIRNSLAHSGNGCLLFESADQDLSDLSRHNIIFYDFKVKEKVIVNEFYLKINIKKDLPVLINIISDIFTILDRMFIIERCSEISNYNEKIKNANAKMSID